MRLNTAIIVSAITLIVGFLLAEQLLWIPISVAAAATIALITRPWYSLSKVGSSAGASVALKLTFSLIGFYAAIGQLVCIGLIVWWLVN